MLEKTPEAIVKTIKNEKSTHELLTNGIILVTIHDDVTIDVEEMNLIRETNLKLSNGKKAIVYVDPGKYSYVTSDARKLTSSKEHSKYRKAQAFIVRNLAERIVGDFYIKVQKPSHPVKMFTNKEKALNWLQQFT
jgi:hypothetical protein